MPAATEAIPVDGHRLSAAVGRPSGPILKLQSISRVQMEVCNAAFSGPPMRTVQFGQRSFEFGFTARFDAFEVRSVFCLDVESFQLELALDSMLFLELIARHMGLPDLYGLPDELLMAVVEACGQELLDQFSQAVGRPVTLTRVAMGEEAVMTIEEPLVLPFQMRCAGSGEVIRGRLDMDCTGLPPELIGLIRRPGPCNVASGLDRVPMPLAFILGRTHLAALQVCEAGIGDIIFIEDYFPATEDEILISIGKDTVLAGQWRDNRVICRHTITWEQNNMNSEPDSTKTVGPDTDDAREDPRRPEIAPGSEGPDDSMPSLPAEALAVDLVFEIHRRAITIGELSGIQPGYVFDTPVSMDSPVTLRANGTVVGHGRLLQIDERIGVQVTGWQADSSDGAAGGDHAEPA